MICLVGPTNDDEDDDERGILSRSAMGDIGAEELLLPDEIVYGRGRE